MKAHGRAARPDPALERAAHLGVGERGLQLGERAHDQRALRLGSGARSERHERFRADKLL